MTGKRVFVVHGWGSSPEKDWFPWAKRELEKSGFRTFVLDMPDTNKPKIGSWLKVLEKNVGLMDDKTYFIGHSIGCQAILRFLEGRSAKEVCGSAVFVAGWVDLLDMAYGTPEEKVIAKPWIETPLEFAKVKIHLLKSIAIFSDNDPCVSLKQSKLFQKKLGSKIIIEKKMGHFTEDDGITELPVVLQEFLKVAK